MSNRSADDVRIFTYATVIFLPLSFVSSVFSMAGAPDRATVQPFIIAAVVALLTTIAFLLNAGTPMRNITYYKNEILKLPQDDSILEHADSQWKAVLRTLHSWLIRLPARNVLIARDILVARQKRRKQGKKTAAPTSRPREAADEGESAPRERKQSITEETSRKQQRRAELKEKQNRRQETIKIVIGILVLPLFLFGSVLRFICQNVFDLVKLLFFTLPRYSSRRLELEIANEEDDYKSILSRDSPSANEQAKKNTKRDDMADEQRRRQDLRAKEKKYHESNLKRFIAMPRIGDLEHYLQKGETLGAAREKLKAKKKESKRDFKDLKKKYMKARKKVVQKEDTTDDKVSEIDVRIDMSSDDSSDNETNLSREHKGHHFGRSISRFFRSHLEEPNQQNNDAEKAGA